MDKYLESLVPKKKVTEQVYEPDEVEIENPIEDADDAAIDDTISEAIEEVADAVEDDAEEVDEDSAVEDDAAPEQELTTEKVIEHELPKVVNVSSIRVYSIPDRRGLARTISGNVELLGFIEDFAIITYVRPGFGPVRGYTDKANI